MFKFISASVNYLLTISIIGQSTHTRFRIQCEKPTDFWNLRLLIEEGRHNFILSASQTNYSTAVLASKSSVGLIEQQVPLFDSMFFEGFVKRMLALTRDRAVEMWADWGADRMWCSAANMYVLKVLKTGQYSRHGLRPAPVQKCLVFNTVKARRTSWERVNLNISYAVIAAAAPVRLLEI